MMPENSFTYPYKGGHLIKRQLIRDRLVRIFAGVILSVSLLALAGFESIYRVSITSLYEQTLQTNYFLSDRISGELAQLEEASRDILSRAETQNFLRTVNELESNSMPYYTQTTAWQKFSSSTFAFMNNSFQTVGIVDLRHRFYLYGYGISSEMSAQIEQIIHTEIKENGAVTWQVVGDEKASRVLCIRAVRNLNFLELSHLGYLFYLIDFEKVLSSNIYNYMAFSQMQSSIYLAGQPVYSDADFDIASLFDSINEEDNYKIFRHKKNQYLLTAVPSGNYDMVYYTAQNINTIIYRLNLFRIALLSFITVGALIIFLVSFRRTLTVTERIETLTTAVQQVYAKNFKTDVAALVKDEGDEVSVLAGSFQTLINQMDTLVNEVLTRKLLFKEAQIRFLQSQINPHFLYNTLDTINALAVINKVPPISAMVSSMASIMRYSLSENILSHVGTELEILKKYTLIQRMRYNERLSVLIFVGQDCEDIEIPKMTLQPLLENAIKYSVENKDYPVNIKLRIYKMHNNLIINAIDTGIGMPTQTALLLRSKQFEQLPGHGLKNVCLRLNNLFGEKLRLSVRTVSGRYTSLRITIWGQGDFINVEKDKTADSR